MGFLKKNFYSVLLTVIAIILIAVTVVLIITGNKQQDQFSADVTATPVITPTPGTVYPLGYKYSVTGSMIKNYQAENKIAFEVSWNNNTPENILISESAAIISAVDGKTVGQTSDANGFIVAAAYDKDKVYTYMIEMLQNKVENGLYYLVADCIVADTFEMTVKASFYLLDNVVIITPVPAPTPTPIFMTPTPTPANATPTPVKKNYNSEVPNQFDAEKLSYLNFNVESSIEGVTGEVALLFVDEGVPVSAYVNIINDTGEDINMEVAEEEYIALKENEWIYVGEDIKYLNPWIKANSTGSIGVDLFGSLQPLYHKYVFNTDRGAITVTFNIPADKAGQPIDATEVPKSAKPVIYLYPEEETNVSVKLDYNGELKYTYPAYNGGWQVTAMPDGTLYDSTGREYSYLFWEGIDTVNYDFSTGYCVPGKDTAEFLRTVLAQMGLKPKEYNEFIVYWLPQMQDNKYNIISFQQERYTDNAVLDISPAPDSMLRVFMTFYASDTFVQINAPEITPFTRNGFTVVEWGGKKLW